MKPAPQPTESIDDYIARFPQEVQEILEKIRAVIQEAAPDAEEAMKYQIPTFVLHGNLVHFAAFAHHIGFYPTPSGIERFDNELSQYDRAKGSVQFPLDQPIPYSLIKKIARFRATENRAKAAAKKPAKSPTSRAGRKK